MKQRTSAGATAGATAGVTAGVTAGATAGFTAGAILALVAAGPACSPKPSGLTADLILRGGVVQTMDDAGTRAQALAVSRGRILALGTNEEIRALAGPATEIVELRGGMVLPGFHDAHVHPISGGIELGQCNLNGFATREAVSEAITNCAARSTPEGGWIVGGGWDLPLFPGANPGKQELDALVAGRPAYLAAADGHSAWVSSRALELAGIDAQTPDPPRGRIEREAPSGEPSGTLRESAMDLVAQHLPELSPDDRLAGLRRALALAHRFGITSLVEASADEDTLRAYRALAEGGELKARVVASLSVDPERGPEQVGELERLREEYSRGRLQATSAKIFADGVIEAGTAALLEPYLSPLGGAGERRGELNLEPEQLDALVRRLDAAGFQVHVHAIGDRAIRSTLDAFAAARAANGPHNTRHHIAHLELIDPEDIPRFEKLGVIANFQPLWAYADTYITELTEPVLGPERSRWLYPIGSVARSGARVVGGSDWSVSSMNPLEAIQIALTRQALQSTTGESWIPEERVDLLTMLTAYTRSGAYLMGQEDVTGTLEVGKAADLVVLDRDLFAVPPQEIHRVKVLLTLLEGEELYRDPEWR